MLEKIIKVIREYKGDEELVITEETLFADLGLDSLDIVELVMSLEEELSTSIEMKEDIATIGDLIRLIDVVG